MGVGGAKHSFGLRQKGDESPGLKASLIWLSFRGLKTPCSLRFFIKLRLLLPDFFFAAGKAAVQEAGCADQGQMGQGLREVAELFAVGA